jgi:ornithine carbamoyltransferase
MARKDFLNIVSLDRAEIIHLLDQAGAIQRALYSLS